MQTEQLTQYSEYLLGLALKKCGNIYDAEDLTQETLLAAISYISKGKVILDFKTWLCSVMNRKFNDALRKKYNHPVIHIGDDFDIVDDSNILDNLELESEYEEVRKVVAYLGKTYTGVTQNLSFSKSHTQITGSRWKYGFHPKPARAESLRQYLCK